MGKLERYLDLGIVPVNLDMYEETREDICPLCDNPNHGFTRHAFKVDRGDEVQWIATYICADCHFEIEEKEVMEEDKYWEGITRDLQQYMSSGTFPKNAHRYTHTPHLCVFCREDLGDLYLDLKLPVGEDMVGGTVYACDECATKFKYTPQHLNFLDNCRRCGEDYPITTDEHKFRYDYENLRMHYCPTCATKEHGDFTPADRFQNKSCAVCGGSVVADLMLVNAEQLKDLRCSEHAKFTKVSAPTNEPYNLFVCNAFLDPNFRAVITDKIDYIKVTYERKSVNHVLYYEILDNEHILPNTITPADLLWKVRERLDSIKDTWYENNKKPAK